MRIAIATDVYLPQLSGIADSIETLSAELIKAGHAVRIYAPRVKGAGSAGHVRRLPASSVPGSGGGLQLVLPSGLTGDLREFRADVIHVHVFGAIGWAGVRAGQRLGVPVVGTDHTFPADYLHYAHIGFPPLPALVRKFAAAFYNRCRVVTAPSQSIIDELRAYGLTSPATVVSNPIRVDLFRPLPDREQLKQKLGIGPAAVLLFGRIAAEKNLDLALDVFATLASRNATAELVIVGDGPHRETLMQRIGTLDLTSRVRFLGALHGEALNEAINACDVYLITSKSETQSMTMLQASAAGLPVVAIRAGALPEYVVQTRFPYDDRQTGYLVDEDDPEGFVTALALTLGLPDHARRLGAQGRDFVQRFAPPGMADAFAAIYAHAMAGLPVGETPAPQVRRRSTSA